MILEYLRAAILSIVQLYILLIFVYCIMTWFPMRPGGVAWQIRDALNKIVDPFLRIFRKFVPPIGGLDLSPIIAVLLLEIVVNILF